MRVDGMNRGSARCVECGKPNRRSKKEKDGKCLPCRRKELRKLVMARKREGRG
jgi:hypothetical protein